MTTMVRVGDRVSLSNGWSGFWTDAHERKHGAFVRAGDVTILCAMCTSIERGEAVCFLRSDGTALCDVCRGGIEAAHLQEMRPDPSARCSCICGESLDNAKSEGMWTIEVACEYRTCSHCGSTRAWMPANEVEGRLCRVFARAGDTRERAQLGKFLDALAFDPITEASTIERDGVVLARAFEAAAPSTMGLMRDARDRVVAHTSASSRRVLAWRVMEPQREKPLAPKGTAP